MTDRQPARVALVTGAAGGIGQATVRRLRARGYAIIAEDLSPKVEELGAEHDPRVAPARRPAQLREQSVPRRHGVAPQSLSTSRYHRQSAGEKS